MKYVKTFENFNPSVNEGWLWGEGNIFSKIGDSIGVARSAAFTSSLWRKFRCS